MLATAEQLTTAQAARALGVSEQTVRVLTRAGTLPAQFTPLGALLDGQAVHDRAVQREARARGRGR